MTTKLLIVPLVLAATLVHADPSLEDKKYWKGQQDYINETLKRTEKACDTTFTFEWIDKDKLRTEVTATKHSPNGVCGAIVSEVGSLCRQGADEKAAVKAKIKGFTCGFAKPRALELSGATLKYMGNNQESNFSDWARPWLMKHL